MEKNIVDNNSSQSTTSAIQPLSLERYKGMGWQRFTRYSFAQNITTVRLAAAEVSTAALSLPVGFVRQRESWHLVAILGLLPGPNLLVGPDGHWLGSYVPASLRSYPFHILQKEDGNAVLGIDEASGLIVSSGGESFFDTENQPSEALRAVWSFLLEVAKGQAQLAGACHWLAEAKVLEPWPIALTKGDKIQSVNGLYRVSEKGLLEIGDEAFLKLRRTGILPVAYAQMLSTGHLEPLIRKAEAHARFQASETDSQVKTKAGLNPMQGFSLSQTIDVDWSKFD